MNTQQKQEIIKKFGKFEKDSGRIEVQVALLTEQINNLTNHLNNNKKDKHNRYQLIKKVENRHKLLKYLYKKDQTRYLNIIEELHIRK